jgi:hypothetical protein
MIMPSKETINTRGVILPAAVFVETVVAVNGYRHLLGTCGFAGNETGRRIIAEADLLVGMLDEILYQHTPPKGD